MLLAVATLLCGGIAGAIEVKKDLYNNGGGGSAAGGEAAPRSNPLTPAIQKKLLDAVQSDSEGPVGEESEKKSSGEMYVDLENAKLKYFPQTKGGKQLVLAKLEAAEYKPSKNAEVKPRPTGKRRALVFTYAISGGNVTLVGQPAWEDVAAKGAKAAAN
jgi:hypothetical protein